MFIKRRDVPIRSIRISVHMWVVFVARYTISVLPTIDRSMFQTVIFMRGSMLRKVCNARHSAVFF